MFVSFSLWFVVDKAGSIIDPLSVVFVVCLIGRYRYGVKLVTGNKGAMVRSMCGVKLVNKKLAKDLMQLLDLNETIEHLSKAISARWCGHVMRKDKNNTLRRALDLKVKWTRKRGMPKKT